MIYTSKKKRNIYNVITSQTMVWGVSKVTENGQQTFNKYNKIQSKNFV